MCRRSFRRTMFTREIALIAGTALPARLSSTTIPDLNVGRAFRSRASVGNFGRPRSLSFLRIRRWTFQIIVQRPTSFSFAGKWPRGRVGAEQPRSRSASRRYHAARSAVALRRKTFLGFEAARAQIPRRLLKARTGKTRQMIARRVRPIAAESSLASSFSDAADPHRQFGRRGRGDRGGSGARPDCGVVCKGDGEQAACFIRPVACFGEPSRRG